MPVRERRVAAQQRKEGGHTRQRTGGLLPCSDGMEHAGEGAAGESEEMTMDWLRTERSMTLSAYPPPCTFFSICTAHTIIPIPARGAIFMKDPPSSEMRN